MCELNKTQTKLCLFESAEGIFAIQNFLEYCKRST